MVRQKTAFISYDQRDIPFVQDMQACLSRNGFEIWLDLQGIQGEVTRWSETQRAILESNFVLIVLSKYSNMSERIGREVEFALSQGKSIIPVLLQEVGASPASLERLQWIDARQHFDLAMRQLLSMLSTTPSSALGRNARNGPEIGLRSPVSRSWRKGFLRDPMPNSMVAVIIIIAIAAWLHFMVGWISFTYSGFDYQVPVRDVYNVQVGTTLIPAESFNPIGAIFANLLQLGLLMWAVKKLSQREFAPQDAISLIAISLVGSFVLLAHQNGWFLWWFSGGDVFLLSFLIAGPVTEVLALIILASQRSVRRYLPLFGYYPNFEKLDMLRRP